MEHLRTLVTAFKENHPGLKANEELFTHLEQTLLPHLLRVAQKDDTLFAEVELFPGIKVNWTGGDDLWKKVHMALLYSVLHGDPKEKFGTILNAIKSVLPGGSSQADELEAMLGNEDTKSSLSDILELIMGTRLMSLIGEMVSSIKFEDLDLDLEDPESLMEMMRNPQEHAGLKRVMERAKTILEEKIKSGKINQQELAKEVEVIRAKFQSSFGKYLNEALLGEETGPRTGNTPQQILSNHPDARRARMLARLQRKQQEKGRK
jgi:hypothetical protein